MDIYKNDTHIEVKIMKEIYSERGITLVELLAALALFGVISALIWNLFFQALSFNDRAVTQNQLQQEANLIVNTIQSKHTKDTITKISISNNILTITYKESTQDVFDKKNIIYEIEIDDLKRNDPFVNEANPPVLEFELKVILTSKLDDTVNFETKTTFSKLVGKNQ